MRIVKAFAILFFGAATAFPLVGCGHDDDLHRHSRGDSNDRAEPARYRPDPEGGWRHDLDDNYEWRRDRDEWRRDWD